MRTIPYLTNSGIMTPEALNPVIQMINHNFRELQILDAPDYLVARSGGQILKIKFPPPSPVKLVHSFQCTLYPLFNTDGTPNGAKVGVEYNSTLFTSRIPLTEFSGITGLNDPSSPYLLDLDGPDDPTTSTGTDDYVFLEVGFESDGVTPHTASIETNGNGNTTDPSYDPWDDSGDALVAADTSTPPKQTFARYVLAEYRYGKLKPNVFGNLVLEDKCFIGRQALYPVPY